MIGADLSRIASSLQGLPESEGLTTRDEILAVFKGATVWSQREIQITTKLPAQTVTYHLKKLMVQKIILKLRRNQYQKSPAYIEQQRIQETRSWKDIWQASVLARMQTVLTAEEIELIKKELEW